MIFDTNTQQHSCFKQLNSTGGKQNGKKTRYWLYQEPFE